MRAACFCRNTCQCGKAASTSSSDGRKIATKHNSAPTHPFGGTQALCAQLDPALAALLDDLAAHGLYDDTLVVCMGEFGRAPNVNADAGRDHWPSNNCVLLGGCGIKPGVVVGETDERSAVIVKRPVQVADLFSTFAQLLALERDKEFNPTGRRPTKLIDPDGVPVRELLA